MYFTHALFFLSFFSLLPSKINFLCKIYHFEGFAHSHCHYFLSLNQCFPIRGRGNNFAPSPVDIYQSIETFLIAMIGEAVVLATGEEWLGYYWMPYNSPSPTTLNYQAQEVNSTDIEESCPKYAKSKRHLINKTHK